MIEEPELFITDETARCLNGLRGSLAFDLAIACMRWAFRQGVLAERRRTAPKPETDDSFRNRILPHVSIGNLTQVYSACGADLDALGDLFGIVRKA